MTRPARFAWLAALGLLAACAGSGPSSGSGGIRPVPSPAGEGSGQPRLALTADGSLLLSWLEPSEQGQRLRFSVRAEDAWASPRTVAEGDRFFVNWADVPSVTPLPGGLLVAHWLQKNGPGPYAYEIWMRTSGDGGGTWSAPFRPHRDRTETEHGFVSIVEAPDGGAAVFWLDGREMTGGHGGHGQEPSGAMTLRAATIDPAGTPGPEVLLDDRVCECCPTAAAKAGDALLVAYRNRSDDEVRDIYVMRSTGDGWSAPAAVHADGWQIPGCPVNGPSLAAAGRTVALAWFTAADNDARVKLAFSSDGGVSFAAPIRVDDGLPLGRVAVALLEDGAALVLWIEHTSPAAELRLRRVQPGGRLDPAITVTSLAAERASGYPRMVRRGSDLFVAWTEAGADAPSTVRLAMVPFGP